MSAARPGPLASSAWTRLVPTERHVEVALHERELRPRERSARRIQGFLEDAVSALGDGARIATAEESLLAARGALDRGPSIGVQPAARASLGIALDRAIGRLRRAGATPRSLRATTHRQAPLLADVLARAEATLAERGLVDRRGAGAFVARRLQERAVCPPEWGLETREIHVTGVVGWELDDLVWVEALHARARAEGGPGVTVELPRLVDLEVDPLEPVAEDLERRWASLADAPSIAWLPMRFGVPEQLVEAKSVEAEARAVVAAVLDGLSGGVAIDEVAVLVPDLDEAPLEALRAAFEEAGVPLVEARGRPLGDSPEARAALGLLAIAAGPVSRDLLIEILRAPGVHTGWWTESAREADASTRAAQLARRLRELPVNADATGELFVDALETLVEGRPADAWMPRALGRVIASTAALRGVAPRRELVRRVLQLYDTLELGSPSVRELAAAVIAEDRARAADLRGAQGDRGGLQPHARLTRSALGAIGQGATAVRAIRDALGAIVAAADEVGLGDASVTPADLLVELEHTLGARGGPGAAARPGAVRVARAEALAGLEHELLVVTRLSAASYGGAGAVDPLLDERLVAELPVVCRPSGLREREARERAALAWAIAGARRVVLTRSAPADQDALGPPHPFARRAVEHGTPVRTEPLSRLAPGASRLGPRAAELARLAAGGAVPPGIAERVSIELERAAFFLDPGAPAGAHTGRVMIAATEDLEHLRRCVGGRGEDATIAVTAIERAAGCAFAGFAGRVLGARRAEETEEAAGGRDRGMLVHRALHAAFEAARPVWHARDREQILAVCRDAAERALRLAPGSGPLAPPSRARMAPLRREAIAQAVGDALAVVAWSFDEDPGVRFALAERRFGGRDEAPWGALELADTGGDGLGSVWVDGQIDRIDRSTDGRRARVIDYKTGKVTSTDEQGRSVFQLPLYAGVVARALGASEVDTLYLHVRAGGNLEERPKKPEHQRSLAADREEAMRRAREVVLAQWRGDAPPRPLRLALCAHCDARDVCRRPAVMPIDPESEER